MECLEFLLNVSRLIEILPKPYPVFFSGVHEVFLSPSRGTASRLLQATFKQIYKPWFSMESIHLTHTLNNREV